MSFQLGRLPKLEKIQGVCLTDLIFLFQPFNQAREKEQLCVETIKKLQPASISTCGYHHSILVIVILLVVITLVLFKIIIFTISFFKIVTLLRSSGPSFWSEIGTTKDLRRHILEDMPGDHVISFNKASDDDDADHDDDDDVIVIIFTCAVLSPKCLKLLHSSSLQEGNLKERYFLYFLLLYFYIFIFLYVLQFYVFCIFSVHLPYI